MVRILAGLALAALLAPAIAGQDNSSRRERFELFNACRPMRLLIEGLGAGEAAIGLSKRALLVAAESRLRAARLYTEDRERADSARLYVNVPVVGPGYNISIRYDKLVVDAFKTTGRATTWEWGSTSTYGRDARYSRTQYYLGHHYYYGRGVFSDTTEAVRWYRLAAEQGYRLAQYQLGLWYEAGLGGVQDLDEAVRWYRVAADRGDLRSQTRLGYLHHRGRGVPKDTAESARWYRLAADRGYSRAQYKLGLLYQEGRGSHEILTKRSACTG